LKLQKPTLNQQTCVVEMINLGFDLYVGISDGSVARYVVGTDIDDNHHVIYCCNVVGINIDKTNIFVKILL
jgi:hypothetical protein